MTYDVIINELLALSSEKLASFSARLINTSHPILGVSTPQLKKLAKRIVKGDFYSYLACDKCNTHEEICLKALIISYADIEINERFKLLSEFIPKIDNWAVCDMMCSALRPIIKKHQDEFWEFIKSYLSDDREFYIRVGVVIILVGFVSEEYAKASFDIFESVKRDDYYVIMAVAWTLAEFFIKLPDITLPYLKKCPLDDITYNKTLQKIIESKRVSDETKSMIRMMKRR